MVLAVAGAAPPSPSSTVAAEVGDVGDLSSLKPLSSDRIFVLLELRLVLEDDEEVDDEDEAVEDELLLLVLAGHFLMGAESESSESELVRLSSVAIERDEMSVLLEVRRRAEDEGGWPPRVTGRRW